MSDLTFQCIGNLGVDPEMIDIGGRPACRLFILSDNSYTDKEGTRQERTNAVNVTVFGKQAETCGEYLRKGRQVLVNGTIAIQKKDDKTYTNFEVGGAGTRVKFLGKKED